LVAFGGNRKVFSINNLVNGRVDAATVKQKSLAKISTENFKNKKA
jgi:hypothetical protein